MRLVKRIVKIHNIKGCKITCLFNNGESRIIDFAKLFKEWKVGKNDYEYKISKSETAFKKVGLIEGTLVWKNIEIKAKDEDGNDVSHFYDIDPITLFESSEIDGSRKIEVGLMIKQTRIDLGLSQTQLADKSGTTKHYISRIENNKSGIELSTLRKIIEGGLGKRLQIKIV